MFGLIAVTQSLRELKMDWIPEHWIGETHYPPRETTVDTQEKLTLLTETFKAMDNAIKNGMPDFALLEVDRIMQMIDGWEKDE